MGKDRVTKPVAVMLIEDNRDHMELVREILDDSGLGCSLRWFSDARLAIDSLLGQEDRRKVPACPVPDLILLDINLPGMSGLEALTRLKSCPETKMIPVVMLTSSSRPEEIVTSYIRGVNSYVVKPMDFDAFREKITGLSVYWTATSELPTRVGDPPSRREDAEAGTLPTLSIQRQVESGKT